MSQTLDLTMDLSRMEVKRDILTRIGALTGIYRVTIAKVGKVRSNQQLKFYWACVVQAFYEYLQAQGDDWTKEQCHEELKKRFLQKREIASPITGEIIEFLGSTKKLSKEDMSAYIERCIQWLAEFFGIVVPAANLYA